MGKGDNIFATIHSKAMAKTKTIAVPQVQVVTT